MQGASMCPGSEEDTEERTALLPGLGCGRRNGWQLSRVAGFAVESPRPRLSTLSADNPSGDSQVQLVQKCGEMLPTLPADMGPGSYLRAFIFYGFSGLILAHFVWLLFHFVLSARNGT